MDAVPWGGWDRHNDIALFHTLGRFTKCVLRGVGCDMVVSYLSLFLSKGDVCDGLERIIFLESIYCVDARSGFTSYGYRRLPSGQSLGKG